MGEEVKSPLIDQEGKIPTASANARALAKAQKAFEGFAEELGVKDEDDVQALIDEIRYGRKRD